MLLQVILYIIFNFIGFILGISKCICKKNHEIKIDQLILKINIR